MLQIIRPAKCFVNKGSATDSAAVGVPIPIRRGLWKRTGLFRCIYHYWKSGCGPWSAGKVRRRGLRRGPSRPSVPKSHGEKHAETETENRQSHQTEGDKNWRYVEAISHFCRGPKDDIDQPNIHEADQWSRYRFNYPLPFFFSRHRCRSRRNIHSPSRRSLVTQIGFFAENAVFFGAPVLPSRVL